MIFYNKKFTSCAKDSHKQDIFSEKFKKNAQMLNKGRIFNIC